MKTKKKVVIHRTLKTRSKTSTRVQNPNRFAKERYPCQSHRLRRWRRKPRERS